MSARPAIDARAAARPELGGVERWARELCARLPYTVKVIKESMRVNIVAKGVGLTVGKSHVDGGTGRFSDVHQLTDVLGSYAQAEAHAGVVKSGTAQVLTKGEVSLALAGKGEGVDLGIDIGEMTLTRAT